MEFFSAVKPRPEYIRKTKKQPKKQSATPLEGPIQDSIMKYLHLLGFVVIRINSAVQMSEKSGMPLRSYYIYGPGMSSGFPDLLAFKEDKYFLFEVKSEKGIISFNQQKVCTYFQGRKVPIYYVAGIDDVERVLKGQPPIRQFKLEKPAKMKLLE